MLRNNKYYIKIIMYSTLGLLIIATALGGVAKYQSNKISDLEEQLYLKKQSEQRASDFYESTVNVKTIQSKFNTLQEYSIQKDNVISKDHTYYYSSDGNLGVKKHAKLVGHGMMRYDINVKLSSAIITSMNNGKTIKIQIEKPYVDEENIGMVNNSLVMNKMEYNFWANKKDTANAQKLFIESFEDAGKDDIIELYNTKDKQAYIEKVAKSEIEALIKTLSIKNATVIVEIIK